MKHGKAFRANGKMNVFLTSTGNKSLLESPVRKKAKIRRVRLSEVVCEGVFTYQRAIPIIAIMYVPDSLAVLNNTTNSNVEAKIISLKL